MDHITRVLSSDYFSNTQVSEVRGISTWNSFSIISCTLGLRYACVSQMQAVGGD